MACGFVRMFEESARLLDLVKIAGHSDVRTLFYPAITSAACGW